MDLLRIFAFLCVLGSHALLNSEFYYQTVSEPAFLLPIALRVVMMCCVPLFLMLSGYLNLGKKLQKCYYRGLLRVVFVYLGASLCCVLFRCWYYEEAFSFVGFLWETLAYDAAPYSWYIQMYLGFFLFFPFLNVCWEALESRKKRLCLVGVFLIVTALPSLTNNYCFTLEGWFLRPSVSESYQQILPEWWQSLYPFSYYFLGAYCKTYPPKRRPWCYLALTLVLTALFGLYNFYRSWGGLFVWDTFSDYSGYQCVAVSYLLFLTFWSIPSFRWPRWLSQALAVVSELTLGAYLLSWIPDEWLYPLLCNHYPLFLEHMVYLPLCVGISAGVSLLLSLFLWLLWWGICRLARWLGEGKKRKKA